MKVNERTIPSNLFSVEENGEAISITAENGWIYVNLSEGGRIRKADEFSFIGFKNALQHLCCDAPLSPPSSDDKTPTTATGEAEKGTPEPQDMKRWNWDRVHGEWYVCENNHSKSSGCEWRPATEAEIMAAGREPNEP